VFTSKNDAFVSADLDEWLAVEHPNTMVKTHPWPHGGVLLPWNVTWTVDSSLGFLNAGA